MYGYWKETDTPTLEQDCADDLGENLPLQETEFTCQPIECGAAGSPPTGYSCSGWDPAGDITYASGVYSMNATVVTELIDDYRPLIFCDDARLQALGTGGFEVQDADAGEMLYELGLRDGDIPLELNGYPLDDVGDVMVAFAELWLTDGETTYDLYILRGTNYVTLDYELIYTLW